MQIKNKLKKIKLLSCSRKRVFSLTLAALMLFMAIPFLSRYIEANAEEIVKVIGRNQWTYGGKTRYEWHGSDGIIYYCAQPGVHNSNPGTKVTYAPGTVNGIYSDLELHCKVAAVGFCRLNGYVNYKQAQIYVWNNYKGNAIIDAYAAQFLAEQMDLSAAGFTLPKNMYKSDSMANSDPIELKLVNGTEYKAEVELDATQLDILSDPGTIFNIQGYYNWTKEIQGNKLIFTFPGGTRPEISMPMVIIPPESKAIEYGLLAGVPYVYYVYQTGQDFISGDYKISTPYYYLAFTTDPDPITNNEGKSTSTLHEEVFHATYNVELQKYDYETGKELEGSEWDILQAFDDSQDGIGDGHNGTISLDYMNPQDSSWDGYLTHKMNLRTDKNGRISHSDVRSYHYAKTYCNGHPEPEESEDEEANEDAWAEWEAQVAECERTASFHSVMEGEAYQAMIADRDQTYEAFINLEYQYAMKESNARTGYTNHGNHSDDARIPVVTLASSESGKEQKWAYEYSDNITSNGIYSPRYKDFTVGLSDSEDDGGGSGYDDELFIAGAVVTEVLDSGKTIRVDIDGDTMTFDLSSASIYYDDVSKIETGCYVDINYQEAASSSTHKATDVYVYGEMEPEYRTVSGYVKSVNGKKIKIEPDDGTAQTDYDLTQASRDNLVYNDYTSSKTISVGDYIEYMEFILKETGYQMATEVCFIPKRYLADAGLDSAHLSMDSEDLSSLDESDWIAENDDTIVELMEEDIFEDEKDTKPNRSHAMDDYIPSEDGWIDSEDYDEEREEYEDGEERLATSSNATIHYEAGSEAVITGDRSKDLVQRNWTPYDRNRSFLTRSVSENIDADITIFNQKESEPKAEPPYNSDQMLMSWKVYDHRFEGEVHINKRDSILSNLEVDMDDFNAYGIAQGDGTLEGAVYGLFAAENISHPDGKTGVIFEANDLVSIATTDRNGDASFMVITEAPGTTLGEDGIVIPSKSTMTNLFNMDGYRDDYKDDDNSGRVYSDNVTMNGNAWIGRPLICGDHTYYIRELARSEGYELSVSGKDMSDTNYNSEVNIDLQLSGRARLNAPYYNNQVASGSLDTASVEFSVESKDTREGYRLTTTDYPKGTRFYAVVHNYIEEEIQIESGTEEVPVVDRNGNPVYKVRQPGEIKYDASGQPIYLTRATQETEVRDGNGYLSVITGMDVSDSVKYLFKDSSGYIINNPASGVTAVPKMRSSVYLTGSSGTATIDPTKPLGDLVTIRAAAMEILTGSGSDSGLGYQWADGDGAFTTLTLSGTTNEEYVNQIVDWYVTNPMWNSAYVEDIYQDTDGKHKAILLYDYTQIVNGNTQYYTWIYEERTGDLYYCAKYPVVGRNGINRGTYRTYVKFEPDEITPSYGLAGTIRAFSIEHMRKIPTDTQLVLGEDYSKFIAREYFKLPDTYEGGEFILDAGGNKIQETEVVPKYITITVQVDKPTYTELAAQWDEAKQSYTVDVSEVDIERFGYDLEDLDGWTVVDFKATAPAKTITVDGKQMEYAKYLEDFASMVLAVNKSQEQIDAENASYIVYVQLPSGTQTVIRVDAGSIANPFLVQERPIKQRIKITKKIQLNEFGKYEDDTYSSVHKDIFTSNYGSDNAAAMMENFQFKVYLKSNLERLYRDEDGNIIWLDRNGNEMIPDYIDSNKKGIYDSFVWKDMSDNTINFPEVARINKSEEIESSNVQKIFTKVEHNENSKTIGDVANNVWAEYQDPQTGSMNQVGEKRAYTTSLYGHEGQAVHTNSSLYSYAGKNWNVKKTDKLNAKPNTSYTRLLETITTKEDESYNYEKFFDAIHVANTDKWDCDLSSSQTNYPGQNWENTFDEQYQKDDKDTSFKPFAWIRKNLFGSDSSYPAKHENDYIENKANTSDFARKNAEASDAVRQFAINWYLEDEVAKLLINNNYGEDVAKEIINEDDGTITVKEYVGSVNYGDEIHDIALFYAIEKANDYLKPFFAYDLDTIYSLVVDTEADGGVDKDTTTIGANILNSESEYYYGLTAYLPYGDYVVVEQQPSDMELGDFKNKHYKIDKPKEVSLPSVYVNGNKEQLNPYFIYDAEDTPEQLNKKYQIRFNEEWAEHHTDDARNYVIRAHGHDGDYEVFKYGLDINKLNGIIIYPSGTYQYQGFSVTQELYDPLKDYYNSPLVADEKDGGNPNSHYYADDGNGGKKTSNGSTYGYDEIEKRYHYAAISEHAGERDNIKSMTGIKTAYDGSYSSTLVPWTVVEPIDNMYDPDKFTGYADIEFKNIFYKTYLRIEKIDSETGENILHDSAIYALYAAERYTNQKEVDKAIANGAPKTTKIGDVKFYLEDTLVTGSYEYLKALGAKGIEPVTKIFGGATNHYTGTVPAGTPVCIEEEQIILYDEIGAKTGDMTVYTTTNDVEMVNEEDDGKSYHDQNTGYVMTPQPVGAGVYVLVELKAPAGYVKSKPIAIEIYSDGVTYYMDGDIEARVNATVYKQRINEE